jgi:hypothetical protein
MFVQGNSHPQWTRTDDGTAAMKEACMKTAIRLFLLTGMFWACHPVNSCAEASSFLITISTAANVVKAGSDIRIDISIKNISDREIDLSRSVRTDLGEWFTDVEVLDEKGNAIPETKYYRALRGKDTYDDEPRRDGKFSPKVQQTFGLSGYSVKPGDNLRDGVVLNKLVDMTRPGKYTVKVRRRDEATKAWVASNAIILTLTE